MQDSGCPGGSNSSLDVFAAHGGYENLTVDYLKKYMKLCGATDKLKKLPTTEKLIVTCCLRKNLPGISQRQIDAILLKRSGYHQRQHNAAKSKLLSDNLEIAYGCVDESDYVAMKSVITEAKDKLIVATQKLDTDRRERPSMVGFAAVPRANDITLAWARAWMPTRGVLSKDTTLHSRWKLKFPRNSPPYVYSKVWGEATELTELGALRTVLE